MSDRAPTDAQYDAAKAWLAAHVAGWTLGQWILLAMLLASQESP